ncbi:NADH:flavin oxidoreductase/NADH oxidase [Salinigranum halophilum]|uniref:NADH:flavin oxidoreductase/NADH oxidase n=1 Tax=Salinigranum halophilum TaxID=2565931 RepID=UPI0010A89841|nr:NADH:flavin oxidoreductase/NADH oxidase [Salinigranum halophilum]
MSPSLFSPLSLRETTIPNRIGVSPMCQYSAVDGVATDWHLVHLGSRAVGGAGLVMTEATAVTPEGRISPEDLGIWTDEQATALRRLASFVRDQGAVPGIQLAHAGRKASTRRPWEGGAPIGPADGGWEVVAPSEVPWPYEDHESPPVHALSTADISGVVDDFVAAAERALDAGFLVAEVHAAHGYLLHEFLSPITNRRTDEYGGDFAGRTRLVREVTTAVRDVWPDDRPVFVRVSATDWLPDRDSWTVDDTVRLAGDLADCGADLVDVSSGGIHPEQELPDVGPGYQVPYAERVRTAVDLPVAAVGAITTAQHADALVRNGRADVVLLGREHLRNPYFTHRAAYELERDAAWPPQYQRASRR